MTQLESDKELYEYNIAQLLQRRDEVTVLHNEITAMKKENESRLMQITSQTDHIHAQQQKLEKVI